MKLVVEELDVESSIKRQNKFTIAATGKAFKLLSDGLYSNKIKAVIRELSCNAYDSHVEAGKPDEPFVVHLPTQQNPIFYVQDFGVGLSAQELEKLYTTYFMSTKTNSNDAIGCLGLGSKSPFAYVDTFTITSWKDGKRHIYNCFLDRYGEPTIGHISSIRTDEPNGVKVEFPVKLEDISRFYENAVEVFTYFKVKPSFKGATAELPTRTVTTMAQGEGWRLRNNNGWERRQSLAVMGNVAYPIDSNQLGENFDPVAEAFLELGLILEFDIGELDIVPSREALGYHEETIKNISERVKKAAAEFSAELMTEIDQYKTRWEAACYAAEVANKHTGKLRYVILEVAQWKGQRLGGSPNLYKEKPKLYGALDVARYYRAKGSRWNSGYVVRKEEDVSSFYPYKNSIFLFNRDDSKTYQARAREYLNEENQDGQIFVINYEDGYDAVEFIEWLGLPEGIYHEIEDFFPKKKRKKKEDWERAPRSAPVKVLKLTDFNDYSHVSANWQRNMSLDVATESGYYVQVHRYTPLDLEGNEVTFSRLSRILEHLRLLEYDITLYGVRKPELENAKNNPNFVNIFAFVEKVKNDILQQGVVDVSIIAPEIQSIPETLTQGLIDNKSELNPNMPAFALATALENKPDINRFKNEKRLLNYLGVHYAASSVPTIRKEIDDFFTTYPLLEILKDRYVLDGYTQKIIDYIKLVEK